MRKIIAKRLLESKVGLPHAYMCVEVEMDALMATRKVFNETFGAKVSVNDFVIKAVASTMRAVPEANAFWTEDSIKFNKTVDVAFAAATPGGLITPVVRDAADKSLLEVSAAAKDMAKRARENKLMPEEFAGGCCSVSNLGMFDISQFVAVLNPPQSTIFAVGSTVAKAFPDGKGGAVAKHVMRMTLSHDARVVDDALAEHVCAAFKERIETPAMMFQ
jgi:pyruvate dehydrogenase E2 component (dihydrolipoamide acetyltransferase)